MVMIVVMVMMMVIMVRMTFNGLILMNDNSTVNISKRIKPGFVHDLPTRIINGDLEDVSSPLALVLPDLDTDKIPILDAHWFT